MSGATMMKNFRPKADTKRMRRMQQRPHCRRDDVLTIAVAHHAEFDRAFAQLHRLALTAFP